MATNAPAQQRYEREPEFDQEQERQLPATADVGTLALLNRGEIDQQIATAKRWPREIAQFIKDATEMATLDEETAGECIYALPRDGRTIEGPSARLAEVVLSAWGNARAGARIVGEDDRFVTAQGVFYDLQHNVAITYEVRRRITDRRGNRFKDDMIGVTANAACSIALRNAVFKGVPKAFWARIYNSARGVVAGDVRTLANRRAEAIKAFQIYGVTPEMIYVTLQVAGVEDITLDHLVTLRGLYTAIKEGETTAEQAFAPPTTQDGNLAARATKGLDEIKRRQEASHPQSPQEPAQPATPAASSETAEPDNPDAEPESGTMASPSASHPQTTTSAPNASGPDPSSPAENNQSPRSSRHSKPTSTGGSVVPLNFNDR